MSKLRDAKWIYILLSLLIAIVLWFYVRNEVNPLQTQWFNNVPITFVGLEGLNERGLMISEGADQTIALSLSAKFDDIKKLTKAGANNLSVSVNISAVTEPGTLSISVQSCKVNFPNTVNTNNIQILDQRPDTIELTISKQATRAVEVRGVFKGSIIEGFQMGEFNITPSTITLSGSEEQVNMVNYAQVTLSEINLSSTFTGAMPFTLIGYDGKPVDMDGISTDLDSVQVTLPVVKLKEVKLTVGLIPGGGATADDTEVTIEPATITVSGSEQALEGLTELSLGSIDLSGVYDGTSLNLPIHPDEALTNVSGITEATVTIRFHGLETRTIEVTNISPINAPDGYTAVAVTQSRQIQIRGTVEAVEAVDPSQIRIVADLSTISADETIATGTRTVPVKIYLDGGSNVGVVGTDYNIVVSITR